MEKNSKRNEKIHKNVGLFKGAIERKANQEIRKKEYNLKRPLTAQEKAKVRHKVAHNFKTQLAVKVGAVSLVGLTIFSTGKMLGEGSGKVEGVTQENSESVTVDANKFKESIKVVGLGDEGVLLVQDENGQDIVDECTYVKYYYTKKLFDLDVALMINLMSVNGKVTNINGNLAKADILKDQVFTADVRFVYTVTVKNVGELIGKGTVIEKIPTGMSMVKEDNPDWNISESTATIDTSDLKPG